MELSWPLVVGIALFLHLLLWGRQANASEQVDATLNRVLPPYTFRDYQLLNVMSFLSQELRLPVCLEAEAADNWKFSSNIITLETNAGSTVGAFVSAFSKKYPELQWVCKDGIILCQSTALAHATNNFLDTVVEDFRFDGSLQELVYALLRKRPDMRPSYQATCHPAIMNTRVQLILSGRTPLRAILETIAQKYQIVWCLAVDNRPGRFIPKLSWSFGYPPYPSDR